MYVMRSIIVASHQTLHSLVTSYLINSNIQTFILLPFVCPETVYDGDCCACVCLINLLLTWLIMMSLHHSSHDILHLSLSIYAFFTVILHA